MWLVDRHDGLSRKPAIEKHSDSGSGKYIDWCLDCSSVRLAGDIGFSWFGVGFFINLFEVAKRSKESFI